MDSTGIAATARKWWAEPFADELAGSYAVFDGRQEPRGRMALLIVDVVKFFIGSAAGDDPGVRWPAACGDQAAMSLPYLRDLLQRARAHDILVVHTRPEDWSRGFGPSVKGEARILATLNCTAAEAYRFDPHVTPAPGELVIAKPRASAFFQTPLLSHLRQHKIETVLVAGCTTSGCVRASVVDAFSHGFTVFVVEEAVFDRSRLSSAVSLFELNAKYADVVDLERATELMAGSLGPQVQSAD